MRYAWQLRADFQEKAKSPYLLWMKFLKGQNQKIETKMLSHKGLSVFLHPLSVQPYRLEAIKRINNQGRAPYKLM